MDRGSSQPGRKGALEKLAGLKGPLLIFGAALFFYFVAGNIEEFPLPGQLGPAFWPKAILILLMVSCVVKAMETLFSRSQDPEPGTAGAPALNVSKLVAMIVLLIGVVFFLDQIGFLLANFLFLILFLRVSGVKKPIPLLLISILGTIFLLYLFIKVVYLPLPRGTWFFEDFTIFCYRLLHLI